MNVVFNTSWKAAALLLALCLPLTACKTTESAGLANQTPEAKPLPPATTYQPRIEENEAYVAYVQQVARRRGILVRWVNKPVKRKVDVKN